MSGVLLHLRLRVLGYGDAGYEIRNSEGLMPSYRCFAPYGAQGFARRRAYDRKQEADTRHCRSGVRCIQDKGYKTVNRRKLMISSNSILSFLVCNGRQMPSGGHGATVRRMCGFDSCTATQEPGRGVRTVMSAPQPFFTRQFSSSSVTDKSRTFVYHNIITTEYLPLCGFGGLFVNFKTQKI